MECTVVRISNSGSCSPPSSEGVKTLGLWRGALETVAKLARFMCGRAIKPVRPPRGTTELLRLRHSDYVTCDGPMARRHRVVRKCLSHSAGSRLSFATVSLDPRHRSNFSQLLTAIMVSVIASSKYSVTLNPQEHPYQFKTRLEKYPSRWTSRVELRRVFRVSRFRRHRVVLRGGGTSRRNQ